MNNAPLAYPLVRGLVMVKRFKGRPRKRKNTYFRNPSSASYTRVSGIDPLRKKFVQNKLMVSLLLIVAVLIFSFWQLDRLFSPTIMKYAEMQTNRIASLVVNEAFHEAAKSLKDQTIIQVDQDENGKITLVGLNSYVISDIVSKTTKQVEKNIERVERGDLSFLTLSQYDLERMKRDKKGFYFEVPLGVITKTALLSNSGPTIPVRFSVIGDVKSNVHDDVKSYGLNNSQLKVVMDVEVNLQVIIPFSSKITTVKVQIPLDTKLIPGDVPNFFPYGSTQNLYPNNSSENKK
jgi:sporulation protein YunB